MSISTALSSRLGPSDFVDGECDEDDDEVMENGRNVADGSSDDDEEHDDSGSEDSEDRAFVREGSDGEGASDNDEEARLVREYHRHWEDELDREQEEAIANVAMPQTAVMDERVVGSFLASSFFVLCSSLFDR